MAWSPVAPASRQLSRGHLALALAVSQRLVTGSNLAKVKDRAFGAAYLLFWQLATGY
jgi:hypothetical protein